MAYLSMSYFLSKKLLKSKTHVDLHQTEPVPGKVSGTGRCEGEATSESLR